MKMNIFMAHILRIQDLIMAIMTGYICHSSQRHRAVRRLRLHLHRIQKQVLRRQKQPRLQPVQVHTVPLRDSFSPYKNGNHA